MDRPDLKSLQLRRGTSSISPSNTTFHRTVPPSFELSAAALVNWRLSWALVSTHHQGR